MSDESLLRSCHKTDDCTNEATHSERMTMGLMERTYNCCESHCQCGWHGDEELVTMTNRKE